MSIQPINNLSVNSHRKYNYLYVKYTGYSALAAASLSVIQALRHKPKSHKLFGGLGLVLSMAHVGVIEWLKK